MYVVNIPKDLVFCYLNDNADVYAFDSHEEETLCLRCETVNFVLNMLKDERYVFFIIRENDNEKR